MGYKEEARKIYGSFIKTTIEETPTDVHFNYSHLAKKCSLNSIDNTIKTIEDNWMNAPNSKDLLNDLKEIKKEIEKL